MMKTKKTMIRRRVFLEVQSNVRYNSHLLILSMIIVQKIEIEKNLDKIDFKMGSEGVLHG